MKLIIPNGLTSGLIALTTCIILDAFTPTAHGAELPSIKGVKIAPIQDFEEPQVPSFLTASEPTALEITNQRGKSGRQSLLWNAGTGATLTLNKAPGLDLQQRYRACLVWIYSERASNTNKLSCKVLNSSTPESFYSFDFLLNFTGWRALWITYETDATLHGNASDLQQCDRMVITSSGEAGPLYFDLLQFSAADRLNTKHGLASRLGSTQQPYIKNDPHYRWFLPWNSFHYKPQKPLPKLSPELDETIKTIQQRIKALYIDNSPEKGSYKKGILKQFQQLKIQRQGDLITGNAPIFTKILQRDFFAHQGIQGYSLMDIHSTYLPYLADQFLRKNDETYLQRYIDVLDYTHDQGWAFGSSMMNQHFTPIRLTGHFIKLAKMRPFIGEARYAREVESIRWGMAINELYREPLKTLDCDYIGGSVGSYLLYNALSPQESDSQRQNIYRNYQYIAELVSSSIQPGYPSEDRYNNIIKPDFSIFHHGQEQINSYSKGGLLRLAELMRIYHGTALDFNDDDKQTILNAAKLYVQLTGAHGARGVTGNRGLSTGPQLGLLVKTLEHLSHTGNRFAIENYLYYLKKNPEFQASQEVLELAESMKISARPAHSMPVHQVFNNAAIASVKGENYAAMLKGSSAYAPGIEIFLGEANAANTYGQQSGMGFLQLLNTESAKSSGIDWAGWDWSKFPGATTVLVPLNKYHQTIKHGKYKLTRGGQRNGGLQHLRSASQFFMHTHGEPKHPLKGFQANKAWFFFGKDIIALGNSIVEPNTKFPVATTLFQIGGSQKKASKTKFIEQPNAALQTLDSDISLTDARNTRIIDSNNNGFIINSASKVRMRHGEQSSFKDNLSGGVTTGTFSTAWIDHGVNPPDASYEYFIRPNSNMKELRALDTTSIYSVLSNNENVQMVQHHPSKTTGLIIHKPNAPLPMNEMIVASKLPIQIMYSQEANGQTALTLCDPDIGVDEEIAKKHADPLNNLKRRKQHNILLQGKWKLVSQAQGNEIKITHAGNNTALKLICRDGLSHNCVLAKY